MQRKSMSCFHFSYLGVCVESKSRLGFFPPITSVFEGKKKIAL